MINAPCAANSRASSFDPSARDRLGSGISRMSRDPGLMLAVLPTAGKRTIRAVGLSRIANTSLHPQPWHRTGSFLQPKCQRLKPGLGQRCNRVVCSDRSAIKNISMTPPREIYATIDYADDGENGTLARMRRSLWPSSGCAQGHCSCTAKSATHLSQLGDE